MMTVIMRSLTNLFLVADVDSKPREVQLPDTRGDCGTAVTVGMHPRIHLPRSRDPKLLSWVVTAARVDILTHDP